MKIKYLLILFFVVFFLFPRIVFAADLNLTGKLLDGKNNPVTNGIITFTSAAGKTIATAVANLNGEYVVSIPQGTYTVTISGPKGSDLPTVTLAKQEITSSSVRNFTMALPFSPQADNPNGNRNIVLYIISAIMISIIFVASYILLKVTRKQPPPEAKNTG